MVHRGNAETKHGRKDFTRNTQHPQKSAAKSTHQLHNHRLSDHKGNTGLLLRDSAHYFRARENSVQLGPDSLPLGLFVTSDTFFDIRLTGAGVHYLHGLTLRMVVQNNTVDTTGGTDVTTDAVSMQLPGFFFNRIELMPDGGTAEDTVYNIQQVIDMWLRYGADDKASIARAAGISSLGPQALEPGDYTPQRGYDEDGLPIYRGESREFFIPHDWCMFTQARMFLPMKKQTPKIRWHCAANPVTSYSASGAPITGVSQVDAILSGVLLESAVCSAVMKKYSGHNLIARVLLHEIQNLNVTQVNAGFPINDLPLTVYNGSYACIWFYVVKGNAALQGVYDSHNNQATQSEPPVYNGQWIPLERVSLQDSSGNPVWYNNVPADYMRSIVGSKALPKTFVQNCKNLYVMPFSTDLQKTLETGANLGGIEFDSNFCLKLIPGAFTQTDETSYNVQTGGMRYALLSCGHKGNNITRL